MANLETGVFVMMLAFSFGFMIWTFLRSAGPITNILRLVTIAVFFGIALFITSGYGVASTSTETINDYEINPLNGALVSKTVTVTSTDVLLPDDGSAAWIGWIFMGFAFVSMALMVRDSWMVAWR